MEGNHPCLEHPSCSQTAMSTPTLFLNKFVFLSFVDSLIHVHLMFKLAFPFIPGLLCLQVRSTDSGVRKPGSNPDFATLSAVSPWFITIAITLLYLGSLICKMEIIKVLPQRWLWAYLARSECSEVVAGVILKPSLLGFKEISPLNIYSISSVFHTWRLSSLWWALFHLTENLFSEESTFFSLFTLVAILWAFSSSITSALKGSDLELLKWCPP